jgi:XTP/dITP diphosphohydrolase
MKLLFATRNQGKIKELSELLAGVPQLELLSLSDVPAVGLIEETGETFADNATLKARGAMQASGLVALADDSGLEVDALGGAPGVHSARYGGEGATDAQRNEKLLRELRDVADSARSARFRCVIALIRPEFPSEVELFEGCCEGRIGREPRGGAGFGYDPLFVPQGLDLTFAELSAEQKNRMSHRGLAMREAGRRLRELLG